MMIPFTHIMNLLLITSSWRNPMMLIQMRLPIPLTKRVVRKELYELHCAIVDTRALVKMVEHHVKPKPKPYVLIQDPPVEA
ncbi:uncharacterized protein G2W53_033423 [Senna tora]|uniref:Uncharacterized protein n=1 Tax=Senna tora TaxID=362788 RepID=A0A834T261_9FABA|nr:uncharacterized protein G2W53_033423 [Senna tora]